MIYKYPEQRSETMRLHRLFLFVLLFVVPPAMAQRATTVQGRVLDAAGNSVSAATVTLERDGVSGATQTSTNATGDFTIQLQSGNTYRLSAEKSGLHSASVTVSASQHDQPSVDLILTPNANASRTMEFADAPNFTVAGVTDWTAVGGHGSDSTLRTSEDLARETGALKAQTDRIPSDKAAQEGRLRIALANSPSGFEANHQLGEFYLHTGRAQQAIPFLQAASQIDSTNTANGYDLALAEKQTGKLAQASDLVMRLLRQQDTADLHRLAGEIDEEKGDPLAAVHEEEQAVRLDPNEQNYFAWGSELLLHRAIWEAASVFKQGVKAHPASARMRTALGSALFAGDLYEEAAANFCAASDLNPNDREPYTFMGRVDIVSPKPLPCVEPRLKRFQKQEPESSIANYLYAMALQKRLQPSDDPKAALEVEALLTRAVALDPQCAPADLQLGILATARHKTDQAVAYYTQAIKADPQLGEAHYRLGVAYDRMGAVDKAHHEFQVHDEIEALQAAKVEQQRKEVKQFLVQNGQPASH